MTSWAASPRRDATGSMTYQECQPYVNALKRVIRNKTSARLKATQFHSRWSIDGSEVHGR
jgi:hypothetical protein